jgi:hypothetical protein
MVKMKDETDTCAKRKRFWVSPNKLQTDTVQSLLSANVIYQPERTMMSINDATPQDWDRLRKQHPPLEIPKPSIDDQMKVYLDLADEEFNKSMKETEWWKQHVARAEQLEYEARWGKEDADWLSIDSEPYEFEEETEEDVVNNPNHYNNGSIECIEGIQASMSEEAFNGYLKGNCMKYLWRYDYKGKPVEDLQKAQWYLAELIKELLFEDGEE